MTWSLESQPRIKFAGNQVSLQSFSRDRQNSAIIAGIKALAKSIFLAMMLHIHYTVLSNTLRKF